MKYPFIDLDKKIEKSEKKPIAEIFQRGENHFRKLEAETLRKTKRYPDAVIATGGGTPCFHDNIIWMNENGITVYLSGKAGELYHRLLTDRENRPLLSSLSDVALLDYIMGALSQRERFYSLAQLKINMKSASVPKVVAAVKAAGKKAKSYKKKR